MCGSARLSAKKSTWMQNSASETAINAPRERSPRLASDAIANARHTMTSCGCDSRGDHGHWRRVRRMSTFVLRLIAPRPNFAQSLTDSEREIMNRHAAHWRPYLERGDMVVFGPVLTEADSYGLAVVETDDEPGLREFAAQDP